MSAGDRDTLAAELAKHQWHQPEGYESIWDQSAHANHEYYYRCAICTNDLDALADVLLASDWLAGVKADVCDQISDRIRGMEFLGASSLALGGQVAQQEILVLIEQHKRLVPYRTTEE